MKTFLCSVVVCLVIVSTVLAGRETLEFQHRCGAHNCRSRRLTEYYNNHNVSYYICDDCGIKSCQSHDSVWNLVQDLKVYATTFQESE